MISPISDRKIRVGIAGCGRISKNHFQSIEQHSEHLDLVAVCDTNPEILDGIELSPHVARYQTLTRMLDEASLDLVVLATPSGLHPRQCIEAAKAGVHVMTEKPMATRWKDGLAMVEACDEAGVRLFVVKQNRRNSTLQLLKRAVDENRFGRVHMVHLNVFWARPQSYYDSAAWRGTWELDGGALMNQASHYIDLLNWMFGPIMDVNAMTATRAHEMEVEDTAVLNVRWRSGALGSAAVTMCTYPKNYEGSITVLGDRGTVRIGGLAVNEIQDWNFEDAKEYDEQIKDANYQTTSVYGFGHPLYYKNVVDVLRGEAEPETDGREGLRSLEVLIAAYLSARDGRTVSLPLEY